MEITSELIKKLREQTGAGMMDCKKYLTEAAGDFNKAIEIFRKSGKKSALKKQERNTSQGLIDAYIHPGNKVGVLIEVNCETDFVARTDGFKELVHDLAMHIAAFNPEYTAPADVPAELLAKEQEIYRAQLQTEGKPEAVMAKIIEGKLAKYYQEVCLLSQPFLKDDSKTVEDYLNEKIATIGENIKIKRFKRFAL